MTDTEQQLDKIYTADEAAERLRLTKRAVITTGKRFGLCRAYGRLVFFTEQDLIDLVEAMRFKPESSIQRKYYSAFESKKAYDRALARIQTEQKGRGDRIAARRAADSKERAERLQKEAEQKLARRAEKRQATQERQAAAKAERARARASKEVGPLDRGNRDPAYWTEERKKALRQERVERMREWSQDKKE